MARKRSKLFPVIILAIGLAAGWWLARHGLPMLKPAPKSDAATTLPEASGDIRSMDFKNFSYAPKCAQMDGDTINVTVRGGEYRLEEEYNQLYFNVLSVNYGDITGDGKAEAVVSTTCNTGGTGQFTEGMVFSMRAGKPLLIGRIEGGDRAYGGIAGLSVKDERLIVQRYATDEGGPSCCPKYIETSGLRWDNGRLLSDGNTTRQAASQQ